MHYIYSSSSGLNEGTKVEVGIKNVALEPNTTTNRKKQVTWEDSWHEELESSEESQNESFDEDEWSFKKDRTINLQKQQVNPQKSSDVKKLFQPVEKQYEKYFDKINTNMYEYSGAKEITENGTNRYVHVSAYYKKLRYLFIYI